MSQTQPVIQLAKQSALKNFSVLVRRMTQHSDQELAKALAVDSATTDYSTLNAARNFLRKAGDELLDKLETQYQERLEDALQAMYSNERVEVKDVKAENLTLIDDQTITQQIRVSHLVGRLSASCTESLGRVNNIIAQLIDKTEVKERDNPFRPELIANTLYEILGSMVGDDTTRHFLLMYAINSLSLYLPEYYVDLCEVFKSGGISPKIYTRPTSSNRAHEGSGNRPTSDKPSSDDKAEEPHSSEDTDNAQINNLAANFSPEMLPVLQRLISLMQGQTGNASVGGNFGTQGASSLALADEAQAGNVASGDVVNVSPLATFQGLINAIFSAGQVGGGNFTAGPATAGMGFHANQGGAGGQPSSGIPVSADLLARLNNFQQMAANGVAIDPQLLASSEHFNASNASQSERMALNLMSVLFELMLRDDSIPEGLRNQLSGLQIPFIKSALIDPATLQRVDHPSRQLLNHMGMVSVGLQPESELGKDVDSEIKRIIKKILDDFKDDTGIFATSLEELKKFMATEVSRSDALSKRYIDAIEDVQRVNYLTHRITGALREILRPLIVDQRIVDFCQLTWVHVLVRASNKIIKAKGDAAESIRAKLHQYFTALPDLIWSSQVKTSTEDRLALIKLLPKLVKIIKSGLNALQLPEEQSKKMLDQLLTIHAHVLANQGDVATKNLPTLDELHLMFNIESIQEEASSKAIAPPPSDSLSIKTALAQKGITAIVQINPPDSYSSNIEHEWLADMQVGTRIEYKADNVYQLGRLIWVGNNNSLFMFKLDKSTNPLIYCPIALSRALRDGSLTFVETAPTFERAIETLLKEAELLKKLSRQ